MEPGVVGALDNYGNSPSGDTEKDQSLFLKRVAIMDVDLVAVAVAFGNRGPAILLRDLAIVRQDAS